ncbi:hypothetical protein AB6A23_04790 [Paenibacillus tarimensis]
MMKILRLETDGTVIAVVSGSEILIGDVQSALDLISRHECVIWLDRASESQAA